MLGAIRGLGLRRTGVKSRPRSVAALVWAIVWGSLVAVAPVGAGFASTGGGESDRGLSPAPPLGEVRTGLAIAFAESGGTSVPQGQSSDSPSRSSDAAIQSSETSKPQANRPSAATARASAETEAEAGTPYEWRRFQPGVWIDWRAGAVAVDAVVVLTEGGLEFVACFPGKEHESIVRLEAAAEHVYQALGLVGLEPGRPPVWDAAERRFRAPRGSLLEVWFLLAEERGAQKDVLRQIPVAEWIRTRDGKRRPADFPFVFGGSRVGSGGLLDAGRTGAGLALVDEQQALVSYWRRATADNSALWAEVATTKVPARGTSLKIMLRAAQLRPLAATVRKDGGITIQVKAAELAASDSKPAQSVEVTTAVDLRTLADLLASRQQLARQLGQIPDQAILRGAPDLPESVWQGIKRDLEDAGVDGRTWKRAVIQPGAGAPGGGK